MRKKSQDFKVVLGPQNQISLTMKEILELEEVLFENTKEILELEEVLFENIAFVLSVYLRFRSGEKSTVRRWKWKCPRKSWHTERGR
jgi:hypothetical protein